MDKLNTMNSNNTVYLTGTIMKAPDYSHEVYGEGFYETTLSVARLSDQTDIIPITISERLMTSIPFEIGNVISVRGQFRSYNKTTDGRSKLMLTVFVREIDEKPNHAMNPNQIEISGFLCKDPVFRTTPFRREICDILVAVNRAYKKSDYIPCIAWGRNARFASSLKIGSHVDLCGRIQSREYQKQFTDGSLDVRTAYEISIARLSINNTPIDVSVEGQTLSMCEDQSEDICFGQQIESCCGADDQPSTID
ncbi:MAG: single-stranded DNA-binding protein [Christensenellaceae bacterium]|jgi:single-stranded DNA-binding protein|nr:single-stranded DNA-binding protein [Christensenellaceae bacterium]